MNTVENNVKLQEVRANYVEAVQSSKYTNALNSCNEGEKEIIKSLAMLDQASGGKLDYLVSVYNAIKQNSFHVDGRDG